MDGAKKQRRQQVRRNANANCDKTWHLPGAKPFIVEEAQLQWGGPVQNDDGVAVGRRYVMRLGG